MGFAPSTTDLPLPIKIGQMMMAGIDGDEAGEDARFIIDDLSVGNIILMGRNVASPRQVLDLTTALQALAANSLGIPLLIATDQEGGRVQRLNAAAGFLRMPSPATVGTSSDLSLVRQFAQAVGEEATAVGVHAIFAPVLDVNDNPDNPVIARLRRSLGETPEQVSRTALALIAGLHDAKVLAGGKHFPGHGNTSKDSHVELPIVDKSHFDLGETELPPFAAAISAGIDILLTAHVSYPSLDPTETPATLSKPILTDLLRDKLGFRSLIVTDGMEMDGITRHLSIGEAAVRAVEAGVDIVLCVRQRPDSERGRSVIRDIRDALLAAGTSGRLSEARIDESLARIFDAKSKLHGEASDSASLEHIGSEDHQRILTELLATVDPAALQQDADGPSLVDRLAQVATEVRAAIHDLTDRAAPSSGPLD